MHKILSVLLIILSALPAFSQQRDKEERKEAQDEKKAVNRDKVDISVFRRQILTLTEFSDQRRKIAELKNSGRGIAKIYAVVDSLNINEDGKFLIGYIELVLGDNSANVYELTFDRNLKRIILVRPTGEQLEVEKAEAAERKPPVKATAKAKPKKKKPGDDDEEEDEDEEDEEKEEKPVKGKHKEDDED